MRRSAAQMLVDAAGPWEGNGHRLTEADIQREYQKLLKKRTEETGQSWQTVRPRVMEEMARLCAEHGLAVPEWLRPKTKASRRSRAAVSAGAFANFIVETEQGQDGNTVPIETGLPITALGQRLAELTSGWPKRVGALLFAESQDGRPLWLPNSDALFAWIGQQIPAEVANPVCWATGRDKVTKGEFYQYLEQTAEAFDAVEAFPHYPPLPRTCYMHPLPTGGDGKALAGLLDRFTLATAADADLVRAFFLSLLWGGQPGQRPAWLFTSEEGDTEGGRGVGKSALVRAGARLVGGHVDGSPGEPIEKLVTRLLSGEGIDKRLVLLDNIKTLRFSWAELEGLITNDVISGHRMYAGEGRRPNTLTFCLTLNGASMSRDMAQRCVPVHVKRPPYQARWEEAIAAFVDANRWAIIGDILAILKNRTRKLSRYSRWGAWEAGVLAKVPDPAECQKVIEERQSSIDDDGAEEALVREAFREELRRRGHNPDTEAVFIPSGEAARIANEALGENRATNKASTHLATLAVPELRKSWKGTARGWCWRGKEAQPSQAMDVMYPMPP
jgi:hypothetical protein